MGRRRVERRWRLADLGLVEQGSESSRRSRVRLGKRIEFGDFFFPSCFLCARRWEAEESKEWWVHESPQMLIFW